jgi:hypothetical protein
MEKWPLFSCRHAEQSVSDLDARGCRGVKSMQDGLQEIPRRCLNCYILDKRPRLTENQVAHGILSARHASRLGSSPRLNASVDLEAGSRC